MRPFHRSSLVGLLLLAACGPAIRPGASAPGPAAITAGELRQHVAFLASDELRGRATPSPGLEAAARYLAREFESYGLRPAGDSGTYVQRFPLSSATYDRASMRFRADAGGRSRDFEYGRDYAVMGGRQPTVSGAAVFGGALDAAVGRSAAEVGGRVLIATLQGAPSVEILSAGERAAATGASAVIAVLDPQLDADLLGRLAGALEEQGGGQPIPVFFLRYDAARELLRAVGADLDALRAEGALAPLPGLSLSLVTGVQRVEHRAPNVVAVVPGSDPALRDEYVVLSAHFDHVGVGRPDVRGDSIYNGADDNASGTSVLLEVAEALAAMPQKPRRSVMFLAVSGEEKGLLGSAYFADHPTVPLGSIVANINMDMVGRNHPDSVVVIGQEYSSLGPLTHQIAREHPELAFTVAPDLNPEEQVFFRSDHFNFARKEIPAIFFTTWLHPDYHQPSDEVSSIDADKLARVARFTYFTTLAVANAPDRPRWTEEGLRTIRALPR